MFPGRVLEGNSDFCEKKQFKETFWNIKFFSFMLLSAKLQENWASGLLINDFYNHLQIIFLFTL